MVLGLASPISDRRDDFLDRGIIPEALVHMHEHVSISRSEDKAPAELQRIPPESVLAKSISP